MSDYVLHYWPIPFRGEFVRAVLAQVGADWTEAGPEATDRERAAEPRRQLVPHMGPPVLSDLRRDVHLAQMPAILAYLAGTHGLLPDDPALQALGHKVVGDANDVLYEMTRHNGAQLWTPEAWRAFRPRLGLWMRIFEETGRRHGLTAQAGFLLGPEGPGLADLVTATLWGTMTVRLPALRPMLDAEAPAVAGLCDRVAALPAQAAQRRRSAAAFGDVWCGGDIETSLRAVLPL